MNSSSLVRWAPLTGVAAALLVATGVLATRAAVLPTWLGWAGIVLTLRGRSPVSSGAS